VVATFSADPTCSLSSPYTAPAACASVSLNCPDYANSSSSPTTACSNQTYYLDVANTVCAGQTFFSVAGNYGSQFGDEISWTVSSNLSGTTLASGIGNLSGANFNFSFGPFNPAIHGTIFTLNVLDSFGDGFNGVNGQIYVSQGGGIVGGPVAGAIGFGGSTIFGLNISISPATITVITPAGNVVQTVQNCNDFLQYNKCNTSMVGYLQQHRCRFGLGKQLAYSVSDASKFDQRCGEHPIQLHNLRLGRDWEQRLRCRRYRQHLYDQSRSGESYQH
jgi:hypothetical protein